MKTILDKIIEITPAFDNRSTNTRKNSGIHGVDMRFLIKGNNKAVQFLLFTNWHLPHVQEELSGRGLSGPMPADLGYHSPVPIYDGQLIMQEHCCYTSGKCYYDGSSINAVRVFHRMLREGDIGLWNELEKYYYDIFPEEVKS
jgi:hypothetical protein